MSSSKIIKKVLRERIFRKLISLHRNRPGALIPLLQETQALFGYLPDRALVKIARSLKLPASHVYGVVTFYTQFRLSPVGENIIKVCHGTACHVAGAEKITESLERALDSRTGETTADGKFTLENVACIGCCSLSPVIMINKQAYGKLTSRKIPSILKKYSWKSPAEGSK